MIVESNAQQTELWAFLLVEELVRCGVSMFYVSPGSRSTPLVIAAARNTGADVHMHVDERGSAFMALGWARQTGRPAAWVTTSGTAVANGHPAVAEARLEGVPMMLLTADRPPELRASSANQTIEQPGIFGRDVVWSFDLPVPAAGINEAFVLTTVDHAVRRSADGPVHLNCMFRKPLHGSGGLPALPSHLSAWSASGKPYTTVHRPPVSVDGVASVFRDALEHARRPLILLGRLPAGSPAKAIASHASVVPVLPDIASQSRLGILDASPTWIAHWDAMLHDHTRWPSLAPDLVLQIGRPPVSSVWQAFVDSVRPARYMVADSSAERVDPGHAVTDRVVVAANEALRSLAVALAAPDRRPDPDWSAMWASLHRSSVACLDEHLSTGFSEQAIVRTVLGALEPDAPLILGSSNPVRHANTFASVRSPFVPVIVNRGASGIDGTVATAVGAARAAGRRATVVLGDLTLLHDLNSLVSAEAVTVVVINNDGGGIFSMLPVSEVNDVFEQYFGTPHGLTFRAAADLFGLSYHAPETLESVDEALCSAYGAVGGVLIEVRTSRGETVSQQRDLLGGLQTYLRKHVPYGSP